MDVSARVSKENLPIGIERYSRYGKRTSPYRLRQKVIKKLKEMSIPIKYQGSHAVIWLSDIKRHERLQFTPDPKSQEAKELYKKYG